MGSPFFSSQKPLIFFKLGGGYLSGINMMFCGLRNPPIRRWVLDLVDFMSTSWNVFTRHSPSACFVQLCQAHPLQWARLEEHGPSMSPSFHTLMAKDGWWSWKRSAGMKFKPKQHSQAVKAFIGPQYLQCPHRTPISSSLTSPLCGTCLTKNGYPKTASGSLSKS